jgi:hypothetical protein
MHTSIGTVHTQACTEGDTKSAKALTFLKIIMSPFTILTCSLKAQRFHCLLATAENVGFTIEHFIEFHKK